MAISSERQSEDSVPERGTEVEPPVAPLQNVSLQERVYEELRAALRGGRFASGETVTSRRLAEMLGTSTMPVRAAMHRLVQQRILEMLPNRTVRVPMLSQRRFDEVTDVRATVEGHAAALAAEQVTDDELGAIKAAHRRMLEAIARRDIAHVVAANEQFHFSIYSASRSELLLSFIADLWELSGPYIAVMTRESLAGLSRTDPPPDMVVSHHEEAIAALGRRDPDAAGKAIATDIQRSANWYRATLFYGRSGTSPAVQADSRRRGSKKEMK